MEYNSSWAMLHDESTLRASDVALFHHSIVVMPCRTLPIHQRRAMHNSGSSPSLCTLFCLGGVRAQDIGVTSVEDGHCRTPEELSAGSAEFNLYITTLSANMSLHSLP